MNLLENISLAINGLIANKMRALLTMLGIIIGIGAVIAITCIGSAMTSSVSSSLESMGVNNIAIQVMERDNSGSYEYEDDDLITEDMLEAYQQKFSDKILGIGLSSSVGTGKIEYRHETNNVSVKGVNEGFKSGATGTKVDMAKGRFISEADSQRSKYVAVVAQSLADKIVPTGVSPVGQEVKVELTSGRVSFTIIGIYDDSSQDALLAMMGGGSDTTDFYIPLSTANELNNVTVDSYMYFYAAAAPGVNYSEFAKESEDFFNERFYSKNERMHAVSFSMEEQMETVQGTLGTVSLAISVIAAISLLVGGIGVMNIMLVSVTERTREIGIRKALGAPDSAIRIQFIVESVIICAIGGVMGILLGSGLGALGGLLLKQPATPSLTSIIIAVGFSMMIGIFFGYYPANKAAKLDPIEALRYE